MKIIHSVLGYSLLTVSFLTSTAVCAQGFSTGTANNSKLHGGLSQLVVNENQRFRRLSPEGFTALQGNAKGLEAVPPLVEDGYVVIDAVAKNNSRYLALQLRHLGMKNISRYEHVVSGDFPVARLKDLEQLTALHFASNTMAIQNQGVVLSQGDAAMGANIARHDYGVKGEGVKVGILSDSYNCLGGALAGVSSGDLPPDVAVLKEANCLAGDYTDEGRAMAEIIHDVAPEASVLFHTSNGGQAAFANGIVKLAEAGAKVIIDDILYLSEPFFQDGIIAQAVDKVHAEHDVSYFSSAGNSGRNAYEHDYSEIANLVNFTGSGSQIDICLEVDIQPGHVAIPVLQWDQPFFSVTGRQGATTDLSMLFFQGCNPRNRIMVTKTNNIGANPVEFAFLRNSGTAIQKLGIIIRRESGPAPGKIKLVVTGGTINDRSVTQSGSSYGHAVARGAMGVGASFYRNALFGNGPVAINSYSAAGGAEILFNRSGQRLVTPEVRKQPAIVGPDGVDTTFFGSLFDDNNFPNFFGTSASAPHVGAVAALMRAHNPAAQAADIYDALIQTADDMDDPLTKNYFDVGYDSGTGYGFINATAALAAISPRVEEAVYCDGKLATIVGTEGSDRLIGTDGDDVIVALGGNDFILSGRGNDTICAGDGNDWIYAQDGDDKLFGEAGRDRLIGGNGKDELYGGAMRDSLQGDAGDDLLVGGDDFDMAFGGGGQDTCDAEFLLECS